MSEAPARVIVDGMNVIGSRPDGWWRDRDRAVRRLVSRLAALASASATPNGPGLGSAAADAGAHPDAGAPSLLEVVFDGSPLGGLEEGEHDGVRVCYSRRPGRDGADDRIVEEVIAHPELVTTVVTADRHLQERVRAAGARAVGPSRLLACLDDVAGPG